jgi:hypothetical protein
MNGGYKFTDLPASAFPFDIYAYPEGSTEDTELAWHRHVAGPGAISIPGIHSTGFPVRVVVRFPDGTEQRT